MSEVVLLAFSPLWALSLGVAALALRLGRQVGRGLVALCACLALWVLALMLAQHPDAQGWAARVVPSGMLLAGGFVHAFSDVARLRARGWIRAMWSYGAAVALLGALSPERLFDPVTGTAGPLFPAIAAVSLVLTLVVHGWMARHAFAVHGRERTRRVVLLFANVLGALGGGGTILLVVARVGSIGWAAPFLFGAIALATWSVLADEVGRHRELLRQGLWLTLVTAVLSAVGLTVFYSLLPGVLPATTPKWPWVLWVCFVAALSLDPLRQWLVEAFARRFFARPLAVTALTDELERTEQRAQHAEQLAELGRVASVVAHEVRNPLGVILAQAKLLEREGASAERVADLRAQVARASRFVDELLRYAKPRPFQVERIDAAQVLERAVAAVRQAQGASGVHVGGTDVTLEADAQALTDALVVLLSNAVIALDGQADARVDVSVVEADGEVRFIVEDNGPGVPAGLAPRLFQLFVTGRGRDHAHPGVGLGLAIAQQHAQRHGGSLRHEAREPRGARFVLSVPR